MTQNVGIILGSTRGIGRALLDSLAAEWGDDGIVYGTARSESGAQKLAGELAAAGVKAEVVVFDLADADAAGTVANALISRHGGVDVVIQNGAYTPQPGVPAADDAGPMIAANNHGTLRVLKAFLPALRENGRMVIVASGFGVLASLPERLRGKFDTNDNTAEAINAAMDAYVASVEAGTAKDEGWPDWVNIPSKVGQVAVTRAFAKRAQADGLLPAGALINAACPGVTLTDATRDFMGTVFREDEAQTPAQAAQGLLWLAALAPGTEEPFAELVQFRKVIAFGD